MVSAIAARLCCRCPLTDFLEFFTVLCTLLFQYLQKLVEGVVRDLTSPKPFHAVKIQGLKAKHVKLCAKFGRKFPLPIFSLSGNLSMESCQSTNGTPPVTRTFDFTRKCLVQRSQRLQRLFEKLRGVYLVAYVAGEKCFVSIIKSCALTRLGFGIGILNILARKVYPIVSTPISLDSDCLDVSFDFTVLMEREPRPYTVDFDTILFKGVTRLRERHRVVFVARLDFRSTDFAVRDACFSVFLILKKCVLRFTIPQYNVLNHLTRQVFPMRFRPLFEFRNVSFEFVRRYIFSKHTTIPPCQQHDMQMDTPHIVNHVAEFDDILLRLDFETKGNLSHGISGIRCLSPSKWEASTLPSGNAWNACQPDTLIISQFQTKVKCFFDTTIGGVYIPALKDGGLTPKILLKTIAYMRLEISLLWRKGNYC